jgi:nucleotide-binding universal stress UspA family protein
MQMSRILVPLDESDLAEAAIPWAAALARAYGAPVHLISVWNAEEESFKRAGVDPNDSIERITNELHAYLQGVSARPEFQGLEVSTEIRLGDPADQIRKVAEDENGGARMLVISSHGRGGFKRMIRGSVADKLVRSMHIPVLVLTPDSGDRKAQLTNILVPLDGSERSEGALPVAREVAAATGATVHLVRVYNPLAEVSAGLPGATPDLGVIAEQMLEAARAYLDETKRDGEVTDVRAGRPLDAIIDYADQVPCDIIVMASHGRGGIVRLAIGSTTDSVTRSAHCPVLVVTNRDEAEE